jgi:uncharacterized protein (TIGR02677 family)
MSRYRNNLEDYPKISEASYLVADSNSSRYRIILRFFFVEHERMRDFLYPDQIYQHVRSIRGMEDYSDDELTRDLNQLVAWKNITANQDTKVPKSIEEFKRNTFRYQITPYTVQIERMLETLRIKGTEFSGSLDKRPFEYLLLEIREFLAADDDQEILDRWNSVIDLFNKIRENTADYLAYISSANAEEKMQTESFFAYKDGFIKYLKDFVLGSPQNAMKIKRVFETQNKILLRKQFERIEDHQDDIPRFESLKIDKEMFINELMELWDSIGAWFLGYDGHQAEYDILQMRTDEAIQTIARTIKRIGERNQNRLSRKRDYLHVASWFDDALDIETAHKISSIVFGVPQARKMQISKGDSRDIYRDIWKMQPEQVITKPRRIYYAEKRKSKSYQLDPIERQRVVEKYRQELKSTRQQLDTYFVEGIFALEDEMIIPVKIRGILLGWTSRGMMSADHQTVTEYGYRIIVHVDTNQKLRIYSDDGYLVMPYVKFVKIDEGVLQ